MNKPAPVSEPRKESAPSQPSHPQHPQRLHAPVRKIAIWAPLIVVTVLAILIIAGAWRHVQEQHEQEDFARKTAAVTVGYVTVHRDSKPHELILPGNVQAYFQTELYAQVTGYLSTWLVDIGDKVAEGQLLAEIAAPAVDAQLRQAVANEAQARANLEIARLNYTRESDLIIKKVVSQQEFDQNRTTYDAAKAALQASLASVQNLEVQQNFEKIVAPFRGKITARQIDIGALVSAGGGSAGTPLYGLAQTDPLRVYVNVPQSNYPSIRTDLPAHLIVREYAGRDFEGKVARYSGAIDPASRTLLTEVDIPNPDGALDAGMYGEVKFILKDENAPIIVPSDALVFQAAGPQVVTVTTDDRIQRKAIQIGRDFGTQMEVLSGLGENDRIVMNPTDDLTDGLQVQATEQKATPAPSGSPQSSGGVPGKAAQ